ncbi:class I adenylate-forming enzyme family protein [Sphingobium sp. EM0848]|uniref:class I adenylate-forming enzyme family protein n=1 Tax=Sphingobium sp. EM0848 TaxID=2743473 RepID=UPI00159BF895|nr:AMP-binding protein [Sphingobium sp. EM0848]
MTSTIDQSLRWWADKIPGNRAIVVGADVTTYGEFEQWTARIAMDLRARGLKAGDRVPIFAPNSMLWCAAALGVIRAGGTLVPLNYRYTQEEAISVAADCTPTMIYVGGDKAGMLAGRGYTLLPIEDVAALRQGEPVDFVGDHDPDAVTVIGYTSGSTARPKGVMLTHRTMLGYALEAVINYPEHQMGATAINVAPLYTSAGTVQLVEFLNLGMTDFIEADFDAERALRLLIEEKVQIFGGVPTFWERIAACPGFAEADLSHIKWAAVGGARVPLALLETWRSKGVILRQLYGLTEAGGNSSVMPASEAVEHPEQCGRGGIFTKHRIVDENGEDVPVGTPGEIILRGPGVMIGYWNNPEATKDAFFGDWLRSGDIGVMDAKGNMQLVDRLKDIIISGGLNIWPLDIEAVINEIDGVDEVAVIGAFDEKFGETPMAIVHARHPIAASEIVDHCNTRLANYKVPRYVVVQQEPLPRLATGKISKRDLKQRYKDAHLTLEKVR